jgi:hypothetical protein
MIEDYEHNIVENLNFNRFNIVSRGARAVSYDIKRLSSLA